MDTVLGRGERVSFVLSLAGSGDPVAGGPPVHGQGPGTTPKRGHGSGSGEGHCVHLWRIPRARQRPGRWPAMHRMVHWYGCRRPGSLGWEKCWGEGSKNMVTRRPLCPARSNALPQHAWGGSVEARVVGPCHVSRVTVSATSNSLC